MTRSADSSVSDGGSEAPPIRVLFADDSGAIRTLARYALSPRLGFTVVAEATDGREALALFEEHQPDCVVLDIEMPGMGGLEALAEFHSRHPGAPVVMLSGFSDQAVTERAMAGGAAAYLDKSSELMKLADTVRTVTAASAAPIGPAPTPTQDVGISDLTEPLGVITGLAALLQSRYGETLDDAGQTLVTHLVAAVIRMQIMVDDLLASSESVVEPAQSQAVPLDSVIDAVARPPGVSISA